MNYTIGLVKAGSITKGIFIGLLVSGLLFLGSEVFAHPGSGIVVDRQGIVYFVDTGSGVWRVERDGTLTKLTAPAYHWMAIDVDKKLVGARLPNFSQVGATVTRASGDSRILVSSDFPIAVGWDGALYYPWVRAGERLQIFRLTPSGSTTVLATLPERTESGPLRWLNGIAASSDGSIYYSENRVVRKITPQGQISTIVSTLSLSGCDSVPEVGPELGTYFRGLDVGTDGIVYVAATGCKSVLKITANGKVATIARAWSPWSPTGVAVSGSDVYVLEYLHTPGDNRREWLPRVRKISSDGIVVTVATIER
jgi:hypothetical protein